MKQEDTKKKILEKALELFAANGYDSVSVGEIAKSVGIKAVYGISRTEWKKSVEVEHGKIQLCKEFYNYGIHTGNKG